MKNAYHCALILVFVCSLFLATLRLDRSTTYAAPLRGDFNTDTNVNLADLNLFLPALHTSNAKFALTGSDNNYIDLFDYNEFLKTLGTSSPISKSTQLACHLDQKQSNPAKMLNVGTWNIGENPNNHKDDDAGDQKAITVGQKFQEYNLDMLLATEVDRLRTRAGSDPVTRTNFPQLVQSQVADKLYFHSVYQPTVNHSVTLVSRFPILETGEADMDGGRKVSYSLVDTPAGNLKVFIVHFTNRPGNKDQRYQCNSMRKAFEYMNTKIQPGDNFIIGGDFNMDYEPGGVFQDGTRDCTDLFHQYFEATCTSLPCKYYRSDPPGTGVIDFIFSGKGGAVRVYQYCQLGQWGMPNAHELYVGTIEM